MTLTSRRRSLFPAIVVAVVLTAAMPATAFAQLGGLIRRATGIGAVLELKRAYEDRETASRVGGTWEVTYVFNGVDTSRVFARTFTNPDIGMIAPARFGRAHGENGHVLTAIAAPTLEQLPVDWHAAARNRREYGGGPFFVFPMTTDTLATERAYMLDIVMDLPQIYFGGDQERQKAWNKRVARVHEGEMLNGSGAVIRRGWNTRDLADANTIVRGDSSARVTATYRRKADTLVVTARRISMQTYSNDGKPGLLPGK